MSNRSPTTPNPTGPSLREKTTHGVMWVVLLSIATRVIGVVQQLVLVWLLAKKDFGLMGLALTVTAFVNLLANPGIDAVLVQRQRRFHLWATPAFWLGMITGTLGMVVTIAAAPLAARAYEQPALVGLLVVMSLAMPLQTLQIVPKALLQAQLRFGTGVLLAFLTSLSTAVLTVLCAYLGFGAYSFAIPLPISAALVAAITWRVARPPVKRTPHFKYWKYMIGDSLTLAGTRAMLSLVGQGDYIVLGLARFPEAAIGTYVFAFNIALQPFRFISTSVQNVIFPSLSQVTLSREQQIRAMVRASRLLTLVIVPACALTILLAEPLFRIVVPARWLDAIPVLQIISIAVMVSSPSWPALSLLMAQRRYAELFRAVA